MGEFHFIKDERMRETEPNGLPIVGNVDNGLFFLY